MAGNRSSVRAFDCPNCGANIKITTAGHAVTIGCPSCGSLIDAHDENYKAITGAYGKISQIKQTFYLPLNTRGELFGVRWEVVGAMIRSDRSDQYRWQDYLLFNPYHGYRFLNQFDGHWTFFKPMLKPPQGSISSLNLRYNNTDFRIFHRGQSKVQFVMGEFYWRVKRGDIVDVADFVSPPLMISAEATASEVDWSLGKYVAPDKIQKAFKIEMPPREPIGVSPCQPYGSGSSADSKSWRSVFFVLLAVLVGVQILALSRASNQVVFRSGFRHPVPKTYNKDHSHQVVTDEFVIKGKSEPLSLRLWADVRNNWLSADIILENLTTGSQIVVNQGVEYYKGRDWSEGRTSDAKTLLALPNGRYRMNIKTTTRHNTRYYQRFRSRVTTLPVNHKPFINYQITLTKGPRLWSNFMISLFLMALPFVIFWWRRRSFEVRRWSNSDYSPYFSMEDS